jgi:hypothetical protein
LKKSLLIITQILFISNLIAQVGPIDFEAGGKGADWTWTVFENVDNPALEIIANPDPTGYNTSDSVAKFTARALGQPFAGCETLHGTDIGNFKIDSSNMIIRIMVWKDVISDVGIKLVRTDSWSLGEIKIPNTKINEWEQLTFDFSSHFDTTYDQLVIFPDFQSRSTENVIYFDNVFGEVGTLPSSISKAENTSFEIYPNPANDIVEISSKSSISELTIYNAAGMLIKSVSPDNKKHILDVNNFESGLYIIKVMTENGITSKKFLKN